MKRKFKQPAEMSVPELRAEFRKIMARSSAPSRAEFLAAVAAKLVKFPNPKPVQYVRAAMLVAFHCRRCAGTGRFITGSMNGKPTGPGGACFRCDGKGEQNDADCVRNDCHDRHYMGRAA